MPPVMHEEVRFLPDHREHERRRSVVRLFVLRLVMLFMRLFMSRTVRPAVWSKSELGDMFCLCD